MTEFTSPNRNNFFNMDEDSSQRVTTNKDYQQTFAEEAYQSRNQGPIPAYTSIEVQEKLRVKSENRYINE